MLGTPPNAFAPGRFAHPARAELAANDDAFSRYSQRNR
jgi:hypothetical protein